MVKAIQYGLMVGFGAAILLFIFGPGIVGAFDLGCMFLFREQCTSVHWNEWRMLWAAFPALLTFMVLVAGNC